MGWPYVRPARIFLYGFPGLITGYPVGSSLSYLYCPLYAYPRRFLPTGGLGRRLAPLSTRFFRPCPCVCTDFPQVSVSARFVIGRSILFAVTDIFRLERAALPLSIASSSLLVFFAPFPIVLSGNVGGTYLPLSNGLTESQKTIFGASWICAWLRISFRMLSSNSLTAILPMSSSGWLTRVIAGTRKSR